MKRCESSIRGEVGVWYTGLYGGGQVLSPLLALQAIGRKGISDFAPDTVRPDNQFCADPRAILQIEFAGSMVDPFHFCRGQDSYAGIAGFRQPVQIVIFTIRKIERAIKLPLTIWDALKKMR